MTSSCAILGAVSFLCLLFQSTYWCILEPYKNHLRGLPTVSSLLNSSTITLEVTNATSTEALVSSNSSVFHLVSSEDYWKVDEGREILKSRVAEAAASVDEVVADLAGLSGRPYNATTRAVMVFLPVAPAPRFRRELRALFLSWLLVRLDEPSDLRTDFVIFTAGEGREVAEKIGCSIKRRETRGDPSRCIILSYEPLGDRPTPASEPSDPLRDYTAYVDCMVTIAEYEDFEYDYILRTDLDTFLMPGFADWIPGERDQLIVGRGGYSSENANMHLKYVTKTLGLRDDKDLKSLGSTWFGNLKLFRATARLVLAVMRWLLTQEFSEFERCCSHVASWPHWHRAVTLLYGGHVALNHIGDSVLISGAKNGFMDFSSVKTEPVNHEQIKHVHCWHTREMFSKFEFHKVN
ncbi:hypothetical protein Pmar_PMAR027768 [Perkinsus marinus ATCC 50983]|uniref:DUF7164 domain-containing protein n=1 Tax=Perkinsus marinus (strain ATCC 50983 / TXsc) TaxID=423536 RepID=C5LS62_PERM5|nr:hypothetical protein Pmar_PMAR027768 [Perkinsus marinus ATCC 50983]EER00424.1 hypothetical protein Pmar_PMAR027768 [Perkinsus marinus ATCC 50983]|eukprot:XP_002767706.1 hypothetical protein Pmar_PMAR027768 [Perkinsus marinus ATCC 50983]